MNNLLDYLESNYKGYEITFVIYLTLRSKTKEFKCLDIRPCSDYGRWSRLNLVVSSEVESIRYFRISVADVLRYYDNEVFLLSGQEAVNFSSVVDRRIGDVTYRRRIA